MDLSDLQIFRSVVHAGGITRAAEKLNRVQSNVTTRVRQLEADLGVELFIREGKKLHLSAEGKLLLDYADRLLDLAQEAREAVHDAKPRGLLRLGAMESTASVRLPVPMNEYMPRYPEVTLELRTGDAARARDRGAGRGARRRAGGGTDRRCAVRENPALRRGAGDHRGRQPCADQIAEGPQRPHRARLRGRLSLSPAHGRLVRQAAARCPIASSRCPPTMRCSAARSPAWASRWCRASCSGRSPT